MDYFSSAIISINIILNLSNELLHRYVEQFGGLGRRIARSGQLDYTTLQGNLDCKEVDFARSVKYAVRGSDGRYVRYLCVFDYKANCAR